MYTIRRVVIILLLCSILVFGVLSSGCTQNIMKDSSSNSNDNNGTETSGSKSININQNTQSADESDFSGGILGGRSGEAYILDGNMVIKFNKAYEKQVELRLIRNGNKIGSTILGIGETKTEISRFDPYKAGKYKLVVIATKKWEQIEEYEFKADYYGSDKFKVSEIQIDEEKLLVAFKSSATALGGKVYKDGHKLESTVGLNFIRIPLKGNGVYKFILEYKGNQIGKVTVSVKDKMIQSYNIK